MTANLLVPANIVRSDDVEWVTNETADPPMWPTDRIRWKTLVSQERNGSQHLLLGIAELASGDIHVLHDHPDFAEVYYVIQGTARVVISDKEYQVGPGTAIYFPPLTKHEIENIGDQTLIFVWAFNKGVEELEHWDQKYRQP